MVNWTRKDKTMISETDKILDLRGVSCPMNWVKAKLALEDLEVGESLNILLNEGDAIKNVSRSIKAEGHKIQQVTPIEDGFRLTVEKADERKLLPENV